MGQQNYFDVITQERKNVSLHAKSSHSMQKLAEELHFLEMAMEIQNEKVRQLEQDSTILNLKYSNLCDIIPIGVFTTDSYGMILEMNQRCAEMIGINKDAAISKSFSRYIAPESQLNYYNIREQAINSQHVQTNSIKLMSRNGPVYDTQIYIKNLYDAKFEHGCLLCFICNNTVKPTGDVTQPSLDDNFNSYQINIFIELLSSISSEINQPLCIINNYIHGCLHRINNNKFNINELPKIMAAIQKQSQRAADMIVRMKNFNSKDRFKIESININEIIKESVSLLKWELTDFPVEIICRTMNESIYIDADKIYVEQIILNLARNALDSMRDNHIRDAKLIIEVNPIDTHSVEISVSDNGPGITPEALPRLLDCHYTTKPYGTGLGLVLIKKIIESHHGKLSIIPKCDLGGACFKFTLSSI